MKNIHTIQLKHKKVSKKFSLLGKTAIFIYITVKLKYTNTNNNERN